MSEKKDYAKIALEKHREWRGKISIAPRCPVSNNEELAVAYTPGVAEPCLAINKDPQESFNLTRRWNLCLVVTDGSAVLGLGNIGPLAGMPVMEGKCALFKAFGDVDAFPLCVNSQDTDEIVNTISNIAGSFGGINLEDIAAPRCFEIEAALKEKLDIPVFHDDQHGTAIVTYAGLINALKIVDKKIEDITVVMNGAGAAGIAISELILDAGVKNLLLCDSRGICYEGRSEGMNPYKEKIAKRGNPDKKSGTLADAVKDADVFIGVSAPGVLTKEMVETMAKDSIVMACANPVPEILPDEAIAGGAKVVATGRSDFPNQINNVNAFPGIFRGAFDCGAKVINTEMNIAAAEAIAEMVSEEDLKAGVITPEAFNPEVAKNVAKAVAEAAKKSGAC